MIYSRIVSVLFYTGWIRFDTRLQTFISDCHNVSCSPTSNMPVLVEWRFFQHYYGFSLPRSDEQDNGNAGRDVNVKVNASMTHGFESVDLKRGKAPSVRKQRGTYLNFEFITTDIADSRSQWPRGLRHELSSPAQTLGSWVRIPLEAWMSVCAYSVCAVLCAGSGRAMG
jgi:hypothetical protein